MTDLTLFAGLDVHKKTISVALVDAAASATVRFYGTIANTPDTLRGLSKKLSKDGEATKLALRVWRAASTDAAWAN
jgi:hypothetical protein